MPRTKNHRYKKRKQQTRKKRNTVLRRLQKLIKREVPPIVVFSATYCPYCKKAKILLRSHLKKLRIPIKKAMLIIEVDTLRDEEFKKQVLDIVLNLRTNQDTVPNIFIQGKHIGGYDKLEQMQENKTLEKKLLRIKHAM